MYLIFDTETTGKALDFKAPYTDLDNWPRLVQLAYQLHDGKGALLKAQNLIVKPEGFTIPYNAEKIHGISTARALKEGVPLNEVLDDFSEALTQAEVMVGHNLAGFDVPVMAAELLRTGRSADDFVAKTVRDTMTETVSFCQLPGGFGRKFKMPKLVELYKILFGEAFSDAHDAAYDVSANAKAFFALLERGVFSPADNTDVREINYEAPKLKAANFAKVKKEKDTFLERQKAEISEFIPFAHLHVHSQFSILQSPSSVKNIVAKAQEDGMTAVAITDLGNMFAAFNAVAAQQDNCKVIVGCELFMTADRHKQKFTKNAPDRRTQQVFLAQNQAGYQNLIQLCSLGFIEGHYAGFPRVDKTLIARFSDNVISLSGGLDGEIAQLFLNKGEAEAEAACQWWKETFGDNFYLELMRHGLEAEEKLNDFLLHLSKKYDIKTVATNAAFYLAQEDAFAQETLLAIKDGKTLQDKVGTRRRERRKLPNEEFYFKSQEEMNRLFADLPQALRTTQEIVEKCEPLRLKRNVLLPKFDLPKNFQSQDDYLRHLSYEGAKQRYPEITPEISKRIDFELEIISKMGFPGYFLIVQDLIRAGREMGVAVGPGRGSAAGSVVAFCTGITNIDPIKYQLLFERFLNPERVTMPDIDIDFDDRGRQAVIDFVVKKYGKKQVAQIITYGTMAAKMSIKDVARVKSLPLAEANATAKLVPDTPGTTLQKAFAQSPELKKIRNDKNSEVGEVVRLAEKLEGSVRTTGIHAAGVIIAPDELLKYIPVCTAKDADLLVTQFDGRVVEDAGMLKMDFLGLKTLTILQDALVLIKKNHNKTIDIDDISLDDEATFALYREGKTVGTFQFESPGMQKYLRELKPNSLEDLIAMNALYRPGPLQFIPNYIDRKHGREPITYPHDLLKPILEKTNGIMVYQEQIMQTAQILAGFSLGKADILRRAMGKKKFDVMAQMKTTFTEGAQKLHGIPKEKSEEIFGVMEKFAAYGFNRSHAAAYSVVAYQTGYLKANYPEEYMASVLTHSIGNLEKITFFMEECKNMGLKVLGPDVNAAFRNFGVDASRAIRFGLGAIKGAGDAAVSHIIAEREKNGAYRSIWDFMERVNLRACNKKTLESLAYAGAFDCFSDLHRAAYFCSADNETTTNIERLIRYGTHHQAEKQSLQTSLFGGSSGLEMPKPKLAETNDWDTLTKLRHEKEVVGFYISGHPLNLYALEMTHFCVPINEIEQHKNRVIGVGGIISEVTERYTKTGRPFALFSLEDYESTARLALFGEDYLKNKHQLAAKAFVYVRGEVRERYNRKGEWELSPKEVLALGDVIDKYGSFVNLRLKADVVSAEMVEKMRDLLSENKGNCKVEVTILHKKTENRLKLDFFSRTLRVKPNPDLFKNLEKLGVTCSLF